jgi:16S rRNA (cytidine1402-2'-O)-methyltransferase
LSTLKLVSLPIGNRSDITERALDALKTNSYFFAEDTRVLSSVFSMYEISTEGKYINSFHDQSDDRKLNKIIELLKSGNDVCFVSDAGSPIISDPAYPIIKSTLESGHEIDTIPGVSSVIVALELSGLPPHPFTFHGFLPRTGGEKSKVFAELANSSTTNIYFESPHRVSDTLELLSKTAPDVDIAVCRELTKKFQSVYRFKASEYKDHKEQITVKGEFVLVINGGANSKKKSMSSPKLTKIANECLESGATPKRVAKLVAEVLGMDSKEVYNKFSK